MATEDDLQANVGLGFDEAAFRREAERAASVFADALLAAVQKAIPGIQATFRKATSGGGMGDAIRRDAQRAGQQAGSGFTAGFDGAIDLEDSFKSQLDGLRRGVVASMKTLENLGMEPDLFAGVDVQIEAIVRDLEKLRVAQRSGLSGKEAAVWRTQMEGAIGSVRTSLREVEPLFRTQIQQGEAARSRNTSAMQRETTLQNAIIRTSAQQQIQQAQSTSRARIELARFTFRQIAFIEQQIARTIRGSVSILGNVTKGIASGLGRITSLFRRTDREMNGGLAGALNARERSLSRSFGRQTDILRRELNQQQTALDRFERRSASGISGLLAGRSRAAGALGLGGGLAVATGGMGIGGLLGAGYSRFTEMERLNLLLTRLTGSSRQAAKALDGFNEAAVASPFALTDVAQLGIGFMTIGKSAEESASAVRVLLDAVGFVGGTSESLQRVGLAIRQVSSNGRLLGEELNQLAEALPGLNLNQILADRLAGGSGSEFRRMREAGEISATEFFDGLISGLGSDQRLVGAAAALTETLGGQASKTRSAFSRLGASIIGAQRDSLMRALDAMRVGMNFLTRFINGDVSPALLALRAALIGVSKGMLAITAARGAVEVLQFMGIAVRAIVTPMGLLVTAVAALAAILQISETGTGGLADRLRGLASPVIVEGMERLSRIVTSVVSVVRNQVIPVMIGLAVILASQVGPAVDAISNVFTGTLIPALAVVGAGFVSAFKAAAPVLEAVAGAVLTLGAAIGSAFTGDFSGLLDVFRNIKGTITRAVAGLGDLVIDTIWPQLRKAGFFIRDFFLNVDWAAVGLGVLQVIETIGMVLGRIATHPAFVGALAAVAAAAGIVAFTFAKGVIDGITDNMSMWGDLIKKGFAQLSIPQMLLGIFGIAALTGLVIGIRGTFLRIGQQAGGSFVKGLGQSLKKMPGDLRGTLGGLFGPTATEQAAAAGRRQADAFGKAFRQANRDITALGGKAVGRLDAGLPFNAGDVRRAESSLRQLSDTLGVARSRSLLFRDTMKTIFNAEARREIGGLGPALAQGFQRTDWKRLGQNAGVGVLAGFGAVMSGTAGGLSKGGIAGIVAASIGAGLATESPWVAGGVAAAGLVAAAIHEIGKEAREAARLVADMAKSWLGMGELEVITSFQRGIVDLTLEASEAVKDVAKRLPTNFGAQFATDATRSALTVEDTFRRLAQGLGISIADTDRYLAAFGDNLSLIAADGAGAKKAFDIPELEEFQRRLARANLTGEGFHGMLDILQRQAAGATGALESLSSTTSLSAGLFDEVIEAGENAGVAGVKVRDFFSSMTAAQAELNRIGAQNETLTLFERMQGSVERVGGSVIDLYTLIIEEAKRIGANIDIDFLKRLILGTEEATEKVGLLARAWDEFMYGSQRKPNTEAAKEWISAANALQEDFDKLVDSSDLLQKTLGELNQQRADRIRGEIQGLESRLANAEKAADRAREALTEFITGRYQDTPAALVDDLIGKLPSIAEAIVGAQALGGGRGEAALRSIFGDLDSDIAGIVQAGFKSGLSAADITRLLDPLLAVMGEVENPLTALFDPSKTIIRPDVTKKIADSIQSNLDQEQIEAGIGSIFNADAEVRKIQKQLDAKQAELDVNVVFSQEQVKAAMAAAGLDTHTINLVADASQIRLLQGLGLAGDVARFNSDFERILAAAALLQAEKPADVTRDQTPSVLQQFIIAPGNDEAAVMAGSSDGYADGLARAGGGTGTRSIIYRPIQVSGGSGRPVIG